MFSDLLLDGWGYAVTEDHRYVSSISDIISLGEGSPKGLSSAGATELVETFRKVLLLVGSPQFLTPLVG